ncbi:MAG: bifunctional UDP-N-acetylglucosamine diphosphorylase/glucosamine-1-phosphate N-acetyltransferase GlmU [Terriglobia bacterium]
MNGLTILILAAGKGTRLKSDLPKVLHLLSGRALIEYVLRAAQSLTPQKIGVVVGHEASRVKEHLGRHPIEFILQDPQRGTGHAVQLARPFWENKKGSLLILSGDVPMITGTTLQQLARQHDNSGCSCTMLSTLLPNPHGYGRVVRNAAGEVEKIVEQRDASPSELEIQEVNTGIYCFEITALTQVIDELGCGNSQAEYYLTDCIELLRKKKLRVGVMVCTDSQEVTGINSRLELAQMESLIRDRKLKQMMAEGVTILDPMSTYVEQEVMVGKDTTLYPNVVLEKGTQIGSGCVIYPNVRITASTLEDNVTILDSCLISESHIQSRTQVGPFAHLRNHAEIGQQVRIGNFVEVKKSVIGDKTKAAHLSYLGDAEIGREANIGAGTITCNYDGVQKHKTTIEDGVFVGSDSQLIAPVTVKRGAYIAAGSTITRDVPEDSLAIARSQQEIKEGWAKKKRSSTAKE